MADINYKMKYENLKSKFMSSVEMAFRLGYEQGAKDSEVQAAAEAQAQQAQAQMGAEQGAPGGARGQEPGANQMPDENPADEAPGAGAPMQESESENPMGSELDQHISTLEGMLSKGELTGDDLKKAINSVNSLKQQIELKKGEVAIKKIAKALAPKKAFAIAPKAQANLSSVQKNALSMQEKIIGDIMNKWESEEKHTGKSIIETLGIEGLTSKKE